MNNNTFYRFAAVAVVLPVFLSSGCLSVKTEHKVEPIEIHATVDLNLNVDKQLAESVDQTANFESFKKSEPLLAGGNVGLDSKSMLVPRGPLSSEEMDVISNANSERKKMISKYAADKKKNYDEVAANFAKIIVNSQHRPFPKGAWYQDADGTWKQK